MKVIKLKSISIHNFKGFSNYTVKFDGQSVDIFGDNDAGKTSIYDAFLWAMFHKDSKERSHFHWKPLDENNQYIEGLQTSVKVVLEVDKKERTFEKIKTSKKVLKRKLERSVFEDSTTYDVDGLNTSTKKIYDDKVSEIIESETFRKLSSINFFMNELMAKERREALFSYFGTKTDIEIIQETDKLKALESIVANSNITDERLKYLQEKKLIEETLKNIPIKIEGIQSVLPEISDINRDELNSQRLKLSKKVSDLQDQLVTIKHGGAAGEYRSQQRLKITELEEARMSYENAQKAKTAGIEEGKVELFSELNKKKQALMHKENELKSLEYQISDEMKHLERIRANHDNLVKEYDAVDDSEFKAAAFEPISFDEISLVCAYCGNEYPLNEQEEKRAHHETEETRRFNDFTKSNKLLEEKFIADKAAMLEDIRSRGQENNSEEERIQAKISDLKERVKLISLDNLEKEVKDQEEKLEIVSKQIEVLQKNHIPFESTEKYAEINERINFYKNSIENSEESMHEQISHQETLIAAEEASIAEIDTKVAMFAELDRQNMAIERLNDQERELSARKGEILEILALFDEFFITKRDLLQAHIDKHFSLINWKLFDFSKEGNLNEDYCEPVINGVPYSDLNNGSQMQAGLDIANTLMKQEGFLLPIIIDNAEGMTGHKREKVKVDTQVIAMYVSEHDKNLRVLTKGA
ncbi:AAA family ATPase [Enterococcus sp.]|uniref:ATP-binding protein n=1 Tax=Enterococcus sp. TaxID=35783 RepID=UPI0028A12EA2|nr:AAA family ATPase [Enterococcus sp.]